MGITSSNYQAKMNFLKGGLIGVIHSAKFFGIRNLHNFKPYIYKAYAVVNHSYNYS